MDREMLRELLAAGLSLQAIGERVGRHPSTVGYWVTKHGLVAVHRETHTARGGLEREVLADLVDAGLSVAGIADAVGRSKATVRHWLRHHGLRTRRSEQRLASGAQAGPGETLLRECPVHGLTAFGPRNPSGYRCLRCRSGAVTERRRRVKAILVADAGGRCCLCGYDRCVTALEFHHMRPEEKRFALSWAGVTRSLDQARAEAAKCILLCSNCHAEVEAGMTMLP
jgi:hypothetical protein